MRKRLAVSGLVITILGFIGFLVFINIPSASMSPEEALGWLVLYPIITLGSLLLGVIGTVLLVLGLALKPKG